MTGSVYLYYTERGKRFPAVYNINCKRAVAYRAMVEARRAVGKQVRIEAAGHGKFAGTNQAGTGTGIGGEVKPVDLEACYSKYEALANKGNSPDSSRDHKLAPAERDLSPEQIKARETFWQSGEQLYPDRETKFKFDGNFGDNHELERRLGIPDMEPAPPPRNTKQLTGTEAFLYCHFCAKEGVSRPVDPTLATISKSTKKVACPDHSLKVRDPRFEETAG